MATHSDQYLAACARTSAEYVLRVLEGILSTSSYCNNISARVAVSPYTLEIEFSTHNGRVFVWDECLELNHLFGISTPMYRTVITKTIQLESSAPPMPSLARSMRPKASYGATCTRCKTYCPDAEDVPGFRCYSCRSIYGVTQ